MNFTTSIVAPFLKRMQDFTALAQLHAFAGDFASQEREVLVARAEDRFEHSMSDGERYRRGAFTEDITVKPVPLSSAKGTIVRCGMDDTWQQSLWNRRYDMYVEGPPLGLDTFTNDPRQIFYDIEFKDSPALLDWVTGTLGDYYASIAE